MAMLGALGDLVLSLSADTARFQSDLGRANRVAEKFGREVGGALGKAAAGLVALAGSAGITALVKSQIDAADAAGELSQQLGISTERLSEYQVAAELNNVSQQQLGVGMRQLAKNQADFIAGTGEAKAALDALGITTEQVKDLNGDTAKLFDLVGGKLAQYQDGMNKSALAQKIFGESGATLIPMFNELERGKRIARELGLVYSQDVAAAADRFNDNMSMVGISVRAVGLNIAKAVLPTLETLSGRLVQAAKDTEGMERAGRIADTGLKLLATGATIVSTSFSLAGKSIGAVFGALMAASQGNLREAWTILSEGVGDGAKEVAAAIASIEKTWDDTAAKVKGKSPETGKKLAAPGLVAAATVKTAQQEIAKMSEELVTSLERQAAGAKMVKDAQVEVNKSIVETLDLAVEANENTIYTWDALGNRIEITREEFDELLKSEKKAADVAKDLGFTFSSAFEDAMVKGEGLRSVLNGIAQDVARILIRKSITEPVAAGLGEIFKGMFPGKAMGGPVMAGVPHIVGERGPELFVPSVSGTVVPNHAMGGGITVVNHYSIDARSDQAAIAAMLERTRRATIADIKQLQDRRGDARL